MKNTCIRRTYPFILMLCHATALANNVTEVIPTGVWQVKHVYIDTSVMSSSHTLPNDPSLVGRTLKFSQENINGSMLAGKGCMHPSVQPQQRTYLDKLLSSTFGTTKEGSIAANYLLPQKAEAQVSPLVIDCTEGLFGPSGESIDSWLVWLSEQSIMINWDNNTLLTLDKVQADALPSPSFNCQRVTAVTERKICTSFELAAWDHSVNDAYKMVEAELKRLGKPEELDELKKSQRKWIADRNACNEDEVCLAKKMEERVFDLTAIIE
ncbi:lysozyme inhibitor LprI family protein [Mixta calida]|uniref:lysozyme inhibitor LprI family protein n=1 Tax=Mixta calida TaxID=665913 RepID=UPI0034D7B622